MNNADALALLQRALNEVAPDRASDWETVTLETTIEDLELDSIANMELIGILEDETGAEFPEDELPNVEHLGHLAKLMNGQSLE